MSQEVRSLSLRKTGTRIAYKYFLACICFVLLNTCSWFWSMNLFASRSVAFDAENAATMVTALVHHERSFTG